LRWRLAPPLPRPLPPLPRPDMLLARMASPRRRAAQIGPEHFRFQRAEARGKAQSRRAPRAWRCGRFSLYTEFFLSTPCGDAARGARRRWPTRGSRDVKDRCRARRRRRGLAARGCTRCRSFGDPEIGALRSQSKWRGSARGARARAVARAAGGVETVGFHGGIGSASRPCGVRSARGAFADAGSRRALESGTAARRSAHGERATPSVRDAARGRGGHALTTAPRGPRAMAGACQGR